MEKKQPFHRDYFDAFNKGLQSKNKLSDLAKKYLHWAISSFTFALAPLTTLFMVAHSYHNKSKFILPYNAYSLLLSGKGFSESEEQGLDESKRAGLFAGLIIFSALDLTVDFLLTSLFTLVLITFSAITACFLLTAASFKVANIVLHLAEEFTKEPTDVQKADLVKDYLEALQSQDENCMDKALSAVIEHVPFKNFKQAFSKVYEQKDEHTTVAQLKQAQTNLYAAYYGAQKLNIWNVAKRFCANLLKNPFPEWSWENTKMVSKFVTTEEDPFVFTFILTFGLPILITIFFGAFLSDALSNIHSTFYTAGRQAIADEKATWSVQRLSEHDYGTAKLKIKKMGEEKRSELEGKAKAPTGKNIGKREDLFNTKEDESEPLRKAYCFRCGFFMTKAQRKNLEGKVQKQENENSETVSLNWNSQP